MVLTRLVGAFVLLLSLSFTSQGRLTAQDVILKADYSSGSAYDGESTFHDAGEASVTSGEFSGPLVPKGWTWEKDGHDFLVYNKSGDLVMTWQGASNAANNAGAITDAPGGGNWGGTWSR